MEVGVLHITAAHLHLQLVLDAAQLVLQTARHVRGNEEAEADVMAAGGQRRVVHWWKGKEKLMR